ncbi:MAG: hypothetical protein C5B54_08550 [Acidobacteria bacterium]|nr:MAG: hypothetical protein C5B54_08550 [Acidobacteriota bacterium]
MRYAFALLGPGVVVAILLPIRTHVNTTPVALAFVLIVLVTAIKYGRNAAFVSSVISVLCLNFFFLPPYYAFTISDPQNWVALAAFLITALAAGDLSSREKKRTEEAQRLNRELQRAFEKVNEADAAKKSEQLKSALLDAVTHDLRTPLTTMKAAVTTVLDSTSEQLDEEGRREMLDVVNMEIDRLNRLLENLIEMAKIEAGAMEPRRAWSTLDEILSIALTRTSQITSRHHVKIDIEDNLPPVRVDEKAVAEVLYVLIENAAKYSPPGSEIVLRIEKVEDNVKVSVEDNGPGIPSALREKVFEKFFRVSPDSPLSTSTGGLGMGLAIARGIIEAHKGRIWIEDHDGSGTRVSFVLPMGEAPKQMIYS